MISPDFILRNFAEEDDNVIIVKRKNSVLRPEDGSEGRFPLITKLHSCVNTRLYIEAYCRLLVEDSRLSIEESTVMKEVDIC